VSRFIVFAGIKQRTKWDSRELAAFYRYCVYIIVGHITFGQQDGQA